MSERRARRGLLIVLGLFLVLGTIYSVATPLGEAPDETEQFQYMRYIVEQRHWPRDTQEIIAAGVKGGEPPLYYGLLGLATSWVDLRPLSRLRLLDPYAYPRNSLPDEVLINFGLLHSADEQWPYRGLILVWHLARLGTLLMALAALYAVYRVVRLLSPPHPELALLATTVAALNPQLIYVAASLQNDVLVALLATLLLWCLVKLGQGDARWRLFVAAGVLLGLMRTTKFATLVMLPETVLVLLVLAVARRNSRYLAGLGLAVVLSVVVSAPWLLSIQPIDPATTRGAGRLLALFDVGRVQRWLSPQGEASMESGLLTMLRAPFTALRLDLGRWAKLLFESYWAYFGPMTVAAPRPVYLLFAALCGLGGLGWLRTIAAGLQRRPTVLDRCRTLWIPALHVLTFLSMELAFFGALNQLPMTAQGRHLFGALAGIALLLALGWWAFWPKAVSARAVAGLGVVLVGLVVCCLPTAVGSANKPWLPVRSAPWPDAPQVESISLGDGLAFAGARWVTSTPGQIIATLFWQATQPPADETVIILELVDPQGAVRAVWAGHPGGGRYPTQAWSAGDQVRQALSWPLPSPYPAGPHTVRLRTMREGRPGQMLELGRIDLPGHPAPAASTMPGYLVYGLEARRARLRDTVLVTWPGVRVRGLAAPDGSLWQPVARTTLGDQAAFVVEPRVRPERYSIEADGPGAAEFVPAALTVVGRERAFAPPAGLQPVGAVFGGTVELAGYELGLVGPAQVVTPGEVLRLRLAWRAAGRIGRHYTVFTHLVDEQGRLWGQHDKLPGQEYSTLFWAPGEVVVDEYAIPVDPAAPAGRYRIAVGLYEAQSGARAPAADAQGKPGGDQVLLGDIRIGTR